MLFDNVTETHIIQAADMFNTKGAPDGFGKSTSYDVIINDKRYPPKPIMAYANELADGTPPTNYFEGGLKEPAFKAYERLGFQIIKKDPEEDLLETYLKEFAEVADDWFEKHNWLEPRYLFFTEFFKSENLEKYEWEDFQKLKSNLHSFGSMAIAGGNALGKANLPMPRYREIFEYIGSGKDPVEKTINNLFKKYEGNYYLPFFGESTITELVMYAFPNKYTVYNFRSQAALELLGISLQPKRGERIGQKFLRFNRVVEPILNLYEQVVTKHTNTTIPLELDQFFSWIYESKVSKKDVFKEFIEKVSSEMNKLDATVSLDETTLGKNYIWVYDSHDMIGSSEAHYEVYLKGRKVFVDLHFEGSNRSEFQKRIKTLHADYNWFKWNKASSIRSNSVYKIQDPDAPGLVAKQLMDIEEKIGPQVREILNSINAKSVLNEPKTKYSNEMKEPLNQILYGPPGTGKTYSVVDEAVQLLAPEKYKPNNHKANTLVFNTLKDQGRVIFTTFHQSFNYEDFIEGIKPVLGESTSDSKELGYQIENGVFKELCIRASETQNYLDSGISKPIIAGKKLSKQRIFKLSLGDTQDAADNEILDYCIENKCIGTGWGEDVDFTGIASRKDIRDRFAANGIILDNPQDFNISAIERLILQMSQGDIVLISNGTRKLKAIAEINGQYYYNQNSPIRFNQFRDVNWLFTDLNIPVKEFYQNFFSQQSIYEIDKSRLNFDFFSSDDSLNSENDDDYLIIIDEINRGNVSQVFGELITLIEVSKRKGMPEELEVTLPYSKEKFSVPKNVHILGTMNTADRSIEALDSALRRRFTFKEIMPDPSLLNKELVKDLANWKGISLSEVLTIMNKRIEVLIDRDHQIGHSYFLKLINTSNPEFDLKSIFADEIIPLLQEYFYNDYVKIGMVLGKGFVLAEGVPTGLFATIDGSVASDYSEETIYKIHPDLHKESFDLLGALEQLLNKTSDVQGS